MVFSVCREFKGCNGLFQCVGSSKVAIVVFLKVVANLVPLIASTLAVVPLVCTLVTSSTVTSKSSAAFIITKQTEEQQQDKITTSQITCPTLYTL